MLSALIVSLMVKFSVVAAAALIIMQIDRNSAPRQRSLILDFAAAAILAVPMAELVLSPLFALPPLLSNGAPGPLEGVAGYAAGRIDVTTLLCIAYVAGLAAMLLRLGRSVIALAGMMRRSSPQSDSLWSDALAHGRNELGFASRVVLLSSNEIAVPVSASPGFCVVIVPVAPPESISAARAVMLHELVHLARHDWSRMMGVQIALCLGWFNPVVWLLARSADQAREEAVDAAVCSHGIAAHDYVRTLLSFASASSAQIPVGANGMAARGGLARRMHLIATPGETPFSAPRCAMLALAVFSTSLMTATTGWGKPQMDSVTMAARPVLRQAPTLKQADAFLDEEPEVSVEDELDELSRDLAELDAELARREAEAMELPGKPGETVRREWIRN